MSKVPRVVTGNMVYHVLNRANNRLKIFNGVKDYKAFESVLIEAQKRIPMRILAYCLMPNHWHFVLYPYTDGSLATFMQWLTLTHAQRWRTYHETIGHGHLYQDRYKSFLIQQDEHFLQVCRYVERNAYRAGLVERAEQWQWSSVWRRQFGRPEQRKLLNDWPVEPPSNYIELLNQPEPKKVLQKIRTAVTRGRPYGSGLWVQKAVEDFGLESTMRMPGRPKTVPGTV